jgi:hypothetical protein
LRPEAEWTGGGNEAEWLEQRAVSKAQDWRTGVVSVAGADLIASEDRLACRCRDTHAVAAWQLFVRTAKPVKLCAAKEAWRALSCAGRCKQYRTCLRHSALGRSIPIWLSIVPSWVVT